MAIHVLRDVKTWLHDRDLTGIMNSVALDYGAALQVCTAFGNTTERRKGGLKSVACALEGFVDFDLQGSALFDNVGVDADRVWSVGVTNDGAEGERAYAFPAVQATLGKGGSVGEMHRLSVTGEARNGPLIRGAVLANRTGIAASGNAIAVNLGAVPAGQAGYAALHVLSVAGTAPTLDVTVESDDGAGFASPTTQITFGQKAAIGSEWAALSGSGEAFWRAAFTVGGTAPVFAFVVVFGFGATA